MHSNVLLDVGQIRLNEIIFDLVEVEVDADFVAVEELSETLRDVANSKLNLPDAIRVSDRNVLL